MWKLFFEICDILVCFIPDPQIRRRIRYKRLFDWREKYHALRAAQPELRFAHVKMIKGGWNIGFIVDNKFVFKTRKFLDTSVPAERIMREKRITDAFEKISPLAIPKIEIVHAGKYVFYKYNFIRGHNMNKLPTRTIARNRELWGRQLAEFINAVHHARPTEIRDLQRGEGDGWNHNDICNNIIVDTKNMRVAGLIDWEYAGWGTLETEFNNCTAFSSHMRASGIMDVIRREYAKMNPTENLEAAQ